MYQYSVLQWVFIFYAYCVMGWIFETTVVSVEEHRWVDRGFLSGPMLPIYGFGAVIMLHACLPLTGHPIALYFVGAVTATVFEYLVGVAMETAFKVKYWDYSNRKFNFQGRICLRSTIAWGFLSLVLPYWLHRPVQRMIVLLNPLLLSALTIAVTVFFVYDVIQSTRTALDLARVIQEFEQMRLEAELLRMELADHAAETRREIEARTEAARREYRLLIEQRRAELADYAADSRDEFEQRLENARRDYQTAAEERRLQLHLALMEAADRRQERIDRMHSRARRVLCGNPTLRYRHFDKTLDDMRRALRNR